MLWRAMDHSRSMQNGKREGRSDRGLGSTKYRKKKKKVGWERFVKD